MRLSILLFALILIFTACSKQTTKRPIAKDLHGQWEFTNAINENEAYIYPAYENATVSFSEDGGVVCNNFNGKNYTGEWYLTTEKVYTSNLSSTKDTSGLVIVLASVFGSLADEANIDRVHRVFLNMTDDNGDQVNFIWMRDNKRNQPKMWICVDMFNEGGKGYKRFEIKRIP